MAVKIYEDVGGLDVAVNDSCRVEVVKAAKDVVDGLADHILRELETLSHQRLQVTATLLQNHEDCGRLVRGQVRLSPLEHVEKLHDAWMLRQLHLNAAFTKQALCRDLVGQLHCLNSNEPSSLDVLRTDHLPVRPLPKKAQEQVFGANIEVLTQFMILLNLLLGGDQCGD